MFEELVDELRNANPLYLEQNQVLIWSRKAAMAACNAAGLTVETMARGSVGEVEEMKEAAVAWLEANKPKQNLWEERKKREGAASKDGGGEGATDGAGGDTSTGLAAADVDGDEDGGHGGQEGGSGDEGRSREAGAGGGRGSRWRRRAGRRRTYRQSQEKTPRGRERQFPFAGASRI